MTRSGTDTVAETAVGGDTVTITALGSRARARPATVAPACTVVIPARNEAGSIAAVVEAVPKDLDAEIVVVDNGSTDATAEIARRAGARVVVEPVAGYGRACRAGVAAARATRVVVFIDGDGSMDPADIPALVGPVLDGTADIVCGSRARLAEPGSLPVHQRFGNTIAVVLLRLLYGVSLSELGPYRSIDASLLRELGIGGSRYAWVAELLARAARRGARITEIDVGYRKRTAGSSKVSGTIRGSLGAGAAILSILLWRRVASGPGSARSDASPTRGGAHPADDPIGAARRRSRTRLPAGLLVAGVALIPIGTYAWVALHQIGYHFELEWLEGGAIELVRRVAHGQSIYTAPSLSNVPWPYTPLYFLVSGGVAKIVGVGFLAPRLVSFVASLGAFAALGLIVGWETGEWSAGVAAAGLYAAAFHLSGDWFDLARVDSLFVLLTLLALAAGRRAATVRAGCLTGALGFLAFFTKQTAVVAIAFAFVVILVRRPRVGAAAIAVAAGLGVASTILMDALTGGWYRYYVFDELPAQGVSIKGASLFWRDDLWHLGHPVVIVGVLALGAVLAGWRGGEGRYGVAYWGSAAAGLLLASWISREHSGGYLDVLMPAFAALALGGGLAWGWAIGGMSGPRDRVAGAVPDRSGRRRALARSLAEIAFPAGVAAALALQLTNWSYPINRQIPTRADVRAGQALLAALRRIPGRVVVLDHPWYATELGKGVSGQGEAIRDIIRAGPSRARTILEANLAREIPSVSAVVLDDPGDELGITKVLGADFVRGRLGWSPGSASIEVTDLHLEPSIVFLRRTGDDAVMSDR